MIVNNINTRWYRLDGLEKCQIGCSLQTGLVYSVDRILDQLMEENDWSYLEAREWFEFNIAPIGLLDGGPTFYEENKTFDE